MRESTIQQVENKFRVSLYENYYIKTIEVDSIQKATYICTVWDSGEKNLEELERAYSIIG